MPIASVFGDVTPLTFGDWAEPLTSVTGLPTLAPAPLGQPAEVTCDGVQRENCTEPVGVGAPPTAPTVATSCWVVPGRFCVPPGVAVVLTGGWTQVFSRPPAKSLSCAVISCEDRVSAMKLEKHGPLTEPAKSSVRSTAASVNSHPSWLVGAQGLVMVLDASVHLPDASKPGAPGALEMAQTVSPPIPPGLTPQTLPSAMVVNCGEVALVPPIHSFTVTDAVLPPLVKLVRTRMSPLV